MKRKILFSIMTIALVGALIGGGIYSYFSDVEKSENNSFTAGTLNLKVGDDDPTTANITVGNLKPGDNGTAATWLTKNIGSIAGNLTVAVGTITNNENIRSEVEENAGDTTAGATEGELGGKLKIAFWMDTSEDGKWSSGDYYLKSDGSRVPWQSGDGEALPAAAYDIVNNYGGDEWANCQYAAANTDLGNFRVEYNFPDGGSSDNQAQSDSCEFTITFTLNQT